MEMISDSSKIKREPFNFTQSLSVIRNAGMTRAICHLDSPALEIKMLQMPSVYYATKYYLIAVVARKFGQW
jgi:hypothetical protein